MKHLLKHCIFAALLACAATEATAQGIYRCGDTYTQTPCAQGRVVDASDARSDAQVADARRVAADERRLASEMASDRRAEQAASRPLVLRIGGKAQRESAAHRVANADTAPPHKGKSGARQSPKIDFVSQAPGSRHKRGHA